MKNTPVTYDFNLFYLDLVYFSFKYIAQDILNI